MMTDIDTRLHLATQKMEAVLDGYLPQEAAAGVAPLTDAMRYSLLSGGKRIRPYLTLSFCRMFGGDEKKALPLAAALEMVHTYSLVHDDLPSVDNDTLRRGRPTCHVVYGEAGALFAGDGLLTRAFGLLAESLSGDLLARAVSMLARHAGAFGMLGGQMLDMEAETRPLAYEELLALHGMKTGALIRCAVSFGLLAADVTDEKLIADAERYAENIGLAFQIVDDVLDVYGDEAALGKPLGSDASSGKTTFLSFYSREQALERASVLTEEAIAAISQYENTGEAVELAEYLLHRKA